MAAMILFWVVVVRDTKMGLLRELLGVAQTSLRLQLDLLARGFYSSAKSVISGKKTNLFVIASCV